MQVLRAAVVGLGNIGTEHARALAHTPAARLVGVCDRSATTARACAERWGLTAGAYVDVADLLATTRPDVVHIATPPSSHVPLALQCLKAGAHVLVEKPLSADPRELETLLQVAEAEGLHVIENYNYLWNRQVVSLREWMAQGRLGDILHVDVEVALDVLGDKSPLVTGHGQPFVLELRGGLVADFLPHLASLANAFLGPHEAAHSVWSRRSESRLASDEWRALVQHGSGTSSLGFSANAKPAGFRLTVVGTQMRARAELYGTLLTVETDRRAAGPLEPVLNGLSVSLAEFSGAVGGLRRKLDGGPAALEGLWALVDQLYRDLGAGRQPTLGHINVREVNSLVQDLLRNAP